MKKIILVLILMAIPIISYSVEIWGVNTNEGISGDIYINECEIISLYTGVDLLSTADGGIAAKYFVAIVTCGELITIKFSECEKRNKAYESLILYTKKCKSKLE